MILVTGITGCIGRAVVERLASSGHDVRCLWHWGVEHPVPRRVELIGGDVRRAELLFEAMEGVNTVINLASIRREDEYDAFEEVHIAGTRNVVEAMKRAKRRPPDHDRLPGRRRPLALPAAALTRQG